MLYENLTIDGEVVSERGTYELDGRTVRYTDAETGVTEEVDLFDIDQATVVTEGV